MLNDIYQSTSNYLKAADLQGAKPVVVIDSAEIQEQDYPEGKKKQIVLRFVGKEKVLGLNYTNASSIAKLTGTEDHNEWIGVAIRLYEDSTKNSQGVVVPCIRIFPDLPEQQGGSLPPPKPKPAANDDIPF
jgi:hypothetical protein